MTVGAVVQLAVYEPGGERVGVLPVPLDMSLSMPYNDIAALSLSYSLLQTGGDLLDKSLGDGIELVAERWNGHEWVEFPNSRFCVFNRSSDPLGRDGKIQYSAPGYAVLLKKAVIRDHEQTWAVDRTLFIDKTPGQILHSLLSAAKNDGVLKTVDWDFTAQKDSAGRRWGQRIESLAFDIGGEIFSALQALASSGVVDWRMKGRTLQVFNPGGVMCRDLTQGDFPVVLQPQAAIEAAPQTESIEALVSRALVRGGGDVQFIARKPDAPTPWGDFETFIHVQGVGYEDTARMMAEAEMDKRGRVNAQYTRVVSSRESRIPGLDYEPGDYVLAPGAAGKLEKLRVRQITQSFKGGVWETSLILNDRFLEADLVRARQLALLSGGAVVAGNGTSAGIDTDRDPAIPVTLTAQASPYADELGDPKCAVQLAWTFMAYSGGSGMYTVEGRDVSGSTWIPLGITGAPSLLVEKLPCGTRWQFRVAAWDGVRTSGWCVSDIIPLPFKTGVVTPPVSCKAYMKTGTLIVEYDGRVTLRGGGTGKAGRDAQLLEVGVSETGTPPNTPLGMGYVAVGKVPVRGLVDGKTYYVWTRLRDTSGNVSDWVPASPERVTAVGVTGSELEIGSVTAAVANFIQATVGQISGVNAQFVKAVVGSITGNKAILNSLWANIIRGRYIEASQIVGDIVRANDLYVGGVKINPECLRGQGTINNPVDYGSTSMDGSSFDVGSSRLGSDELSVGAVKVNSWGNGWIPRCDAERLAAESLSLGEQNGDSISGRYSISYDSWQGVYCNATFKAGGLNSESTIYASGEVMASDFVKNSSRASKYDPEPVRDVTRILEVEPVAYRSRALVDKWREQFGEAGPSRPLKPLPERQAGWVAEDLEAAGLGIFVKHNQDGEILGVEYDAIPVALWQVLRKQQNQIAVLEQQVAELRGV